MNKDNSRTRQSMPDGKRIQSPETPKIFRERSNYVISTGGASVFKGLSRRRDRLTADELIDIVSRRPRNT
jgi:hypothetical protein